MTSNTAILVNASSKRHLQQHTAHKYGCIALHVIFGLIQLVPISYLRTFPFQFQPDRSYEKEPNPFDTFRNLVISALVFDGLVVIANLLCVAFLTLHNSKYIRNALVLYLVVSVTSFILNTTIFDTIFILLPFFNLGYTIAIIVSGSFIYIGIFGGIAFNTFWYLRKLDRLNNPGGDISGESRLI